MKKDVKHFLLHTSAIITAGVIVGLIFMDKRPWHERTQSTGVKSLSGRFGVNGRCI